MKHPPTESRDMTAWTSNAPTKKGDRAHIELPSGQRRIVRDQRVADCAGSAAHSKLGAELAGPVIR